MRCRPLVSRSSRRGVALLEAIVSLAILSAAGISAIALVSAGLRSEQNMRIREQEVRAADRVLTAMSLLTAGELDQRLGNRRIGEFEVNVQRPEPTLYRLAVRPASTDVDLLVTVVYRRASTDQ